MVCQTLYVTDALMCSQWIFFFF